MTKPAWIVVAVVAGVSLLLPAAAAQVSPATTAPGPNSAPASVYRPGDRVIQVATDDWPEFDPMAKAAGTAVRARGGLWSNVLLMVGIVFGLFLYVVLRKGLLAAPWRWYRFVRWVWGGLFVGCLAVAGAYGGLLLGVGFELKHQVRTERLVDRAAASLYDAAARGLTTAETVREFDAAARSLYERATADYLQPGTDVRATLIKQVRADQAGRHTVRMTGKLVDAVWTEEFAAEFRQLDTREVVAMYLSMAGKPEALAAYQRMHPRADLSAATADQMAGSFREGICNIVDKMVWPEVATALGIALAAMFIPAMLLRLLVRLTTH